MAVSVAALRSLLVYQTAFIFSLLASTFGTLAMFYLWRSVLTHQTGAHGYDWPHMKAYLLVAFVAGSMVSSYTDYRMASRILQGDVALDLVRPMNYQAARFAEAIGFALYEVGTAVLAAAVAVAVFGGVPAPSAGQSALALISMLLVLPLRFGIVYASGLLTFWTQNYIGVQAARTALVTLFSGALVPLAFLPEWLRMVAYALPFAGMAATPAMIYANQLQGRAALLAIAVQAAWAVGLWLLARGFWRMACRQLTVHGG